MQPGAVLLSGCVQDYESQTKTRRGHSLTNIRDALKAFSVPPDSVLPATFGAFDVFVGYLVFDALIANRDRHDHNWSVLRPPHGQRVPDALCGTYDHASGLGFSLTDERRARRLRDGTVRAWAERGTAYKLEHASNVSPPTLVEMAANALGLCSRSTQTYWLDRVASLDAVKFREILGAVPGLTDVTVDFAFELLVTNRERIFSDC